LDEKINLLEFSTKNKTKNLGLLYLRLVILIISTLVEIIFSEPIKSIKLYSITGSFINKQLINGYIDVSDLPIGVYFLSVNQYPIKFLKQ